MRLLKYILLVIVLLAAGAGAAVYFGFTRIHEAHKGYQGDEVFVEVPSGTSPAAIGQQLIAAGVIRDAMTFRGALWLSGQARALKAGEYRFDRPMTAMEVVDKIARGDVYRRLLTFREGLTIGEMAALYQDGGFGTRQDFEKAARNPAVIAHLDSSARDLEGYLFPETYTLGRDTSAAALIAQMVELFEKSASGLIDQWKAQDLTVREAVTVASLVEKETGVPDERPLIAAVYLNRRRRGMPMQADPTVIYALQREGRYDGNLRRDDLQFDSPYNTYRYPGLPPGPIAAPGKASLEAVGQPADAGFLYFVSKNDGSHVFATTLEEHNRNVRQWQVDYFRRRSQNGR
jgi:UPF0755 protein